MGLDSLNTSSAKWWNNKDYR